ncbi:hypothetical protein J2T60_001884 [Natronospira proteinivora]|uniref:Uncharacterized protein n=1 Tax=Natronospira proteinivora TaxID=1807133 RepID=A0ABT1G9A9_9GAMM|nr:hypothetical protein [Natronospira proteinivora]MCP1727884.1 hypothetical protein [Natronospira proteinivora]
MSEVENSQNKDLEQFQQWLARLQVPQLQRCAERHFEAAAQQRPRRSLFGRKQPFEPPLSRPLRQGHQLAVSSEDGLARLRLDNEWDRLQFSLTGTNEAVAAMKPALFLQADVDLSKVQGLEGWHCNKRGEYYRYLPSNGGTVTLGFADLAALPQYTLELRAARSQHRLPDGVTLLVTPGMPGFAERLLQRKNGAAKKKS